MLKALDVASPTVNHAHLIAAAGYQAVGVYLRSDRTPPAEIEGLHSVGIKVFSIWERGYPTTDDYFGVNKGQQDAQAAIDFARLIGQPKGAPINFCVDYDPSDSAIAGPIRDYFGEVHALCSTAGYLVGCYGSGSCCSYLIGEGVCHYGYLSMSTGFAGYQEFKSKAAIIQSGSGDVAGLSVDFDTVVDEVVVW